MAAATILIFVSVVHRFGTGVPFLYPYLIAIHISWAQELCIYMFIWMAKFGAAYGVRTGIHVGVDVLINQLNPRWQKGVILFGLLGGALFTVIVGTDGREIRHRIDEHRSGLARSGTAELAGLCLHSARLVSDVLPLSAGVLDLLQDRRPAAS